MSEVAYESKPKVRSVVRSSMHPCPGDWVAIGCTVVYYTGDLYEFPRYAFFKRMVFHVELYYLCQYQLMYVSPLKPLSRTEDLCQFPVYLFYKRVGCL